MTVTASGREVLIISCQLENPLDGRGQLRYAERLREEAGCTPLQREGCYARVGADEQYLQTGLDEQEFAHGLKPVLPRHPVVQQHHVRRDLQCLEPNDRIHSVKSASYNGQPFSLKDYRAQLDHRRFVINHKNPPRHPEPHLPSRLVLVYNVKHSSEASATFELMWRMSISTLHSVLIIVGSISTLLE